MLSAKLFAAVPSFGKVVLLPRGHKRPTRRSKKSPEVWPNVRTRARDYTVGASASGNFNLIPPFPPRVNTTLSKAESFSARMGKIEYRYTPQLRLPPHGGKRWVNRFERIDDSK